MALRGCGELCLEVGSGADAISRSVLAGAVKASGLTSCREALEGQDHLPCHCWHPSLPRSIPACGTTHVMLHAGVWMGGACRAPGLCLTFSLALAQPGDILGFSLP